ncbi:hypothetical protein T4E_11048 [Trichinella pseudospiralis]|uniref:Uncharacterized protein n=1 Tax=Trichinella pseudospiralis TaxID=6337 RepID=A0A0V0YMF3_TRIPS|nr:hypothetical protein T4E_11048 [Trichinella pseudospiralis]
MQFGDGPPFCPPTSALARNVYSRASERASARAHAPTIAPACRRAPTYCTTETVPPVYFANLHIIC